MIPEIIQDVVLMTELARPGLAELVTAKINDRKCFGLQIHKGHILVRNNDALPLVDGRTCTRAFGDVSVAKYTDVLAQPVRETGTLSSVVVIPGTPNYYHFLVFNLPALLLLRMAKGPRATLATVQGFPSSMAALLPRLLPTFAGDRPVDIVTLTPGDYAVTDVVMRAKPTMPLAVEIARIVQRMVLRSQGIADTAPARGPLKLFLRRGHSGNGRNLSNQAEIEAWFAARGYAAIDPGTLSWEDQIVLFARATHIAGAEGAAFANLLFAPNAKDVTMLASPATREERFFSEIATTAGLPFKTIYGDVAASEPQDRRTDFTVPLAALSG
jgi:capsular polysaccharide biosynthesis protein